MKSQPEGLLPRPNLMILGWLALLMGVRGQDNISVSVYDEIDGIGNGTKFIIGCCIVSGIICFFRDSTYFPNLVVFLAVLFPLLVLLVIYLLPKDFATQTEVTDDSVESVPTDYFMVKTVLIFVIIFLIMVVSFFQLIGAKIFNSVSIRRIDSEIGVKYNLEGSNKRQPGVVSSGEESVGVKEGEKKEEDGGQSQS
mmetsp:Transcript_12744/g.21491  ORF Transcript_12744/g.21491 Transcript_12744/m.21491 type:complete len:196 (-) Transcript_12744:50-637(-)